MKIKFTKMQGCGNDYIYINAFEYAIQNPEALSQCLSDRHFGIGGDGIILVCPSEVADAKMRIFNLDGSEAKMCGNGIRCVGQYLYEHGMVDKKELTIDTLSGIKYLTLKEPINDKNQVAVDMGAPILEPVHIPVKATSNKATIQVGDCTYDATFVSMGNPHCVIFCDDVAALDLAGMGPLFEKHPMFPEGVNTEFVERVSATELKMRVWERGSGETLACGTGTCASVVAAVMNGYAQKDTEVVVHLIGGDLRIRYTDETVYMTGEAQTVFEGEINV